MLRIISSVVQAWVRAWQTDLMNFYCSPFQQITDINECANNNGGCSDHCNNNPASYSCACRQYADLDPDGRHCTCRPGFIQNDTSVTCDGKGGGTSVSDAAMLYVALVL